MKRKMIVTAAVSLVLLAASAVAAGWTWDEGTTGTASASLKAV